MYACKTEQKHFIKYNKTENTAASIFLLKSKDSSSKVKIRHATNFFLSCLQASRAGESRSYNFFSYSTSLFDQITNRYSEPKLENNMIKKWCKDLPAFCNSFRTAISCERFLRVEIMKKSKLT